MSKGRKITVSKGKKITVSKGRKITVSKGRKITVTKVKIEKKAETRMFQQVINVLSSLRVP